MGASVASCWSSAASCARGLLDRHAGAQPADEIDLALCRETEGTIRRNRSRRSPDLDAARVVEIGTHDTDDDARLFVDGYPPTDDVRYAAEVTPPVPVADDGDRLRTVAILGEGKTASEQRLRTEHLEESASDQPDIGVRRRTAVAHDRTPDAIAGNTSCALEKLTLSCDSFDLDIAEGVERRPRRGRFSPREDQPVLFQHRQRPQQHPLDQCEHHRRRGDAQRECQHGSRGERLGPPQQPHGVTHILVDRVQQPHVDHHQSPGVSSIPQTIAGLPRHRVRAAVCRRKAAATLRTPS